MRDGEGDSVHAAIDAVPLIGGGIETLGIVGDHGVQVPASPQRREPGHLRPALEDPAQAEEIVVAPQRQQYDERGDLLYPRAGLSVPCKPIGDTCLHEVDAVDEAAARPELGRSAEQLEVVSIVAPGAVGDGDGPELSGPRAAAVARP